MLFILLFISLFTVAAGKYNVFENHTIELKFNELAFFETPDFPQLHNATKFFNYNVTFYTNDVSLNGTNCIMVFQGLSYSPTPFKDLNDIYVFETSAFYLESYKYVLQFYDAFTGYIYFESINDNCPFESQSRSAPYNFTDETENILIQTVYKNKTEFGGLPTLTPNRLHDCKWNFTIPDGYGIKIVIVTFNISPETVFQIHNSTDLIANERGTRANHAYFNSDNFIQIYLSKDEHSVTNEIEFGAYVSIVKQNVPKTDGKCVITKNGGNSTWASALNLTQGYNNNVVCDYEVLVLSGTSILAVVQQYSLENFADYLIYHDDMYSYQLNLHKEFVLNPYINGTEKSYYFKFISDGSVQASGFLIQFYENVCRCGDSIILCKNETLTVMKNTSFICPKLRCILNIQSCSTEYTALIITAYNYTDIDYIRVISDEIIVYDSGLTSIFSDGDQRVYLKSESTNTLIINSVSRAQKHTTFSTSPFKLPPIEIYATLMEDGYGFVIDEAATNFALIKVDDTLILRKFSIVIYGKNHMDCNKNFFTSGSLSEKIVLKKCEITTYFYKCYTDVTQIAYFFNAYSVNCFLAVSLSKNPQNCVFPSTVYFVQGDLSFVSVMSTQNGECRIIILKEYDKYYSISNIFTTAYDENVVIYFGKNQDMKFLEFNSRTSGKWSNIKFMAEVFSIKVPKGAVLLLTLISEKLPLKETIQAPYLSLFSSPNFGMKLCTGYGTSAFFTFTVYDIETSFTVLELLSSDNAYFQVDNDKIRINARGTVYVFKNQVVSVYFEKSVQNYCGFYLAVEAVSTKMNYLNLQINDIVKN